MEIRKSYLAMIKEFGGGSDAMAAALAMSKAALHNRIYEIKGQGILVDTAMQMQSLSRSTFFAEAIATESGGVFVKLPDAGDVDREALLLKFNDLYTHLGDLSAKFKASISDDEIDKKERKALQSVGQEIHKTIEELLALTFVVYCQHDE